MFYGLKKFLYGRYTNKISNARYIKDVVGVIFASVASFALMYAICIFILSL